MDTTEIMPFTDTVIVLKLETFNFQNCSTNVFTETKSIVMAMIQKNEKNSPFLFS